MAEKEVTTTQTEPQPVKEKKLSAADKVSQIFIDAYFVGGNPSNEEIQKALTENGLHMSDGLLSAWRRDVARILAYLDSKGKLKKK